MIFKNGAKINKNCKMGQKDIDKMFDRLNLL